VSPEIFYSSYEDSDLVGGWRYSATLQLKTPLAYLEMDGEFSPGHRKPWNYPDSVDRCQGFTRLSVRALTNCCS